jgi:hypothetical protein
MRRGGGARGLGYVERVTDDTDARVRRVRRSERAVARARALREALERERVAKHGAKAMAECSYRGCEPVGSS